MILIHYHTTAGLYFFVDFQNNMIVHLGFIVLSLIYSTTWHGVHRVASLIYVCLYLLMFIKYVENVA